jgi:hypothetical protein
MNTETRNGSKTVQKKHRTQRRQTPLYPSPKSPPIHLKTLIMNRRWWYRSQPFPHIVAEDVFAPDLAAELVVAFQQFRESPEALFTRNMPGYDAFGMQLLPDRCGPFSFFLSRAWHDLIAKVARVEATGDIIASLHHHKEGSASGRVHNDLNPAFFTDHHHHPMALTWPIQSGAVISTARFGSLINRQEKPFARWR